MQNTNSRIVSLLPSTTEIVAALRLEDNLVGRSHECDFPASVKSLPACTEPKFEAEGTSYEIDQRVKAVLQEGLSVYRVDAEMLARLQPDVILTQDHCEACAASVDEVKKAVDSYLGTPVQVISVSPANLSQVFDSIMTIAEALDKKTAVKALIDSMRGELSEVQKIARRFSRKKVLCIEWIEPLMTAGNWVPELAEFANAETLAAKAGTHSPQLDWEEIRNLDPEVISIMPCGYSIEETLREMDVLTGRRDWNNLQAVKNGQVYIADGHHYFNRPGPRLTDSVRILAEIVHPELQSKFQGKRWINYHEQQVVNHG